MTAVKKVMAMRQLDSMFGNMNLEGEGRHSPVVSSTVEHDPRCEVHGRCSTPYRSSLYLHSRESTPGYYRESVSPTNGLIIRRRDSLGLSGSPARELEHPSTFPSILRRERHSPSVTPPRRDTPSPTHRFHNKRHSMGSFPNLSRSNIVNYNRRDSISSNSIRDMKRDYVGSTNSLSRKSSIDTKKSSTDSLDVWHGTTWESDKHNSVSSLVHDERVPYGHNKAQIRNGSHPGVPLSTPSSGVVGPEVNGSRPTFKPVTILEDLQAVRCAEFHPNGKLYAVGSNTKTLRICTYPKIEDVKDNSAPTAPTVLLKRTKHHKGSIYCLAWSPAGDLLATGSNDKTVKLMRFNSHACNLEGQEVELTMHDGTVRDVCFIEDTSNKTSLLVSGGAGDCKIYVTDCATGKTFQALSGHSGHILSLYNWGGAMFVSGSQDKTVRFWDLRTGGCVNIISPPAGQPNKGSAVASLAVDPSGRLLVCGHDDGSCALHDVRGSRALQRFTPHSGDLRSVRFSPGAYYLLTAGYDGRVVLTDLQGDLTCALPSVPVARHPDKVISARWHPDDFSFLSTSADKTAVLWTIPPV
ncbi:WD repeat-containing protein 47 isoform X3 [Helicoverpa armigera]|uniref:WD repeat-containing protein 47 isoform X3 n=1 Tax=Helicoverpa armigera TaxID=29058 RepID=UPI000B377D1E|nr:WD repeat-containing protein 47 isoform X3 [Helicoverpa armigera]XP_047040523.1 WD repeat-containing protein 47 isoform X2 [Helicoverpa zea]